ncbi:MAG: hypothetical protein INF65_11175 [Roseomonas sp.]|nr:hypothetical protein [Roseomonas sp.]MCA3389181.1 hypothetical protein [Roseomonas sp.]MCA3393796.1 hypothetical protein [Roseomonas sp.]MCA3406653.1 hypothetical protein [Roseomonas sp.]
MSHLDDAAQAVDPKCIDILIDAAAPEKAQAWRECRKWYGVSFHPIADRKGVTLRAQGRRIEFDNKTMTWLWLLGFAGWRAFRIHGPQFWWREITQATIDGQLRSTDPTYADAEGDLGAILYVTGDFLTSETVENDFSWPDGVPQPQADKRGFDIEQQAAFDLTMIATAYMLLHEVRHVMFNVDGERPSEPEEELACDAYARAFLLEGVEEYAKISGEKAYCVLAKRAAGIALGAYALYEFTPEGGRGGTADYPPVADRLEALFPAVDLQADHWFWDFAASLLVSIVVNRDHSAVVPDLNGRNLCNELVGRLRQRHQT